MACPCSDDPTQSPSSMYYSANSSSMLDPSMQTPRAVPCSPGQSTQSSQPSSGGSWAPVSPSSFPSGAPNPTFMLVPVPTPPTSDYSSYAPQGSSSPYASSAYSSAVTGQSCTPPPSYASAPPPYSAPPSYRSQPSPGTQNSGGQSGIVSCGCPDNPLNRQSSPVNELRNGGLTFSGSNANDCNTNDQNTQPAAPAAPTCNAPETQQASPPCDIPNEPPPPMPDFYNSPALNLGAGGPNDCTPPAPPVPPAPSAPCTGDSNAVVSGNIPDSNLYNTPDYNAPQPPTGFISCGCPHNPNNPANWANQNSQQGYNSSNSSGIPAGADVCRFGPNATVEALMERIAELEARLPPPRPRQQIQRAPRAPRGPRPRNMLLARHREMMADNEYYSEPQPEVLPRRPLLANESPPGCMEECPLNRLSQLGNESPPNCMGASEFSRMSQLANESPPDCMERSPVQLQDVTPPDCIEDAPPCFPVAEDVDYRGSFTPVRTLPRHRRTTPDRSIPCTAPQAPSRTRTRTRPRISTPRTARRIFSSESEAEPEQDPSSVYESFNDPSCNYQSANDQSNDYLSCNDPSSIYQSAYDTSSYNTAEISAGDITDDSLISPDLNARISCPSPAGSRSRVPGRRQWARQPQQQRPGGHPPAAWAQGSAPSCGADDGAEPERCSNRRQWARQRQPQGPRGPSPAHWAPRSCRRSYESDNDSPCG